MKHRDYIAQREVSDPEFRKLREASRPKLQFRIALVRARLAAGLTQAEVAKAIGTKQSAIARLESGESNPTLDMMARLATALSVSFEIRPNATVEAHEAELSA